MSSRLGVIVMRLSLWILLCLHSSVGFGQKPDTNPPLEKPKFIPAKPLTPEEEAQRNSLARYGVGRLRQNADRLADAAKQYRAAAEAAPDSSVPLRELVKTYAALGRDPAAIRAARQVLKLDPTDADTAELLGRMLFDANQFAESAKAYQTAAENHKLAKGDTEQLRCWLRSATAAEKALDPVLAEVAVRAALTLLVDKKLKFLKDGMAAQEYARMRAELYERLGQACLGQRKLDAATAAFETARDQYNDPKQANLPAGVYRLHANLAEVHASSGQFEQAVVEHAKYLKYNPAGVAPYVRHAELLRAADSKADVVGIMNRLATDNPRNPAPRWVAAAALSRTDFDSAHRMFLRLIVTADKPEYFPILVRAYRTADRPAELLAIIEDVYRSALPPEKNQDPDKAAVQRARYLTTAVKALPQLAGPLVRQLAASTARHNFEVYELVTGLGMRHGYADIVTEMLLTVARRDARRQKDRRINFLLFETLSVQRRWRELATAANELCEVEDNKISLYEASQAAIAYAELGEERRALDSLKRMDGRIFIRLQTARVWTALGKPKLAVAECEEIFSKDRPRGEDLHMVRITYTTALLALKEYDKAETELRAMLEDDPDDVLVLNNLGYNLADQGRKLPEAEALIRRAIELDQFNRIKRGTAEASSGTYLDSLGWVLFRRGKVAEARTVLEQVITSPDANHDATVWDHLGDVYFRLDEKTKARTAWEKAAELYTDCHQGREAGRLDEVRRKIGLTK